MRCLLRPEKGVGSLVLKVQVVVNEPVWMLGAQLWSSGREGEFFTIEPSLQLPSLRVLDSEPILPDVCVAASFLGFSFHGISF